MKRIAILFEAFPRAGSQRNCLEIIKGIKLFSPDIDVSLFLIAPVASPSSTYLPEIERASIPVREISYVYDRLPGTGLLARVYNWISRRWREKKLNSKLYDELARFDSLVCFQPFVLDLLLPNISPKQLVCFHMSEHNAQRKQPVRSNVYFNRRVRLVFQHYSQIAQLDRSLKLSNSIIWPLRLCADNLRPPIEVIPSSAGSLRIRHYSRISPMRFIERIIDAFSLLNVQRPSELHIVGYVEDFSYYKSLIARIEMLGLSGQVYFLDPVPSPAEDPDRSNVDLVWMISLSGHVGYAGIEAMAASLPTLLLEVDTHQCPSALDSELSVLICETPHELVDRTLMVLSNLADIREEQKRLVLRRFITTKQGIDELTSFYLGA